MLFLSPAPLLEWWGSGDQGMVNERTRLTMANHWIVRHGVMRFLGTFDPGSDTYARGDEVMVRSERGQELGQVLCPATPEAVGQLSEPTRGRILRRMSDQDRSERQRLKELET